MPHSNIFSSTWATSIFHFKWVLPFPVKIYPFEIFTRATPGSSLVSHKWLEILVSFFYIMKIWYFGLHLALVTCYYPNLSKNGSHLKRKCPKILVLVQSKTGQFSAFLTFWKKCLTLRGWSYWNYLTHRKLRGISGKMKSISFIWWLVVACVTTGLVTVLLSKLDSSCRKNSSRREETDFHV